MSETLPASPFYIEIQRKEVKIHGNPNYVPPELVEKARGIDLPTYFEMFEPAVSWRSDSKNKP